MQRTVLLIVCLLLPAPTSRGAEPLSPIEKYRTLEFPPDEENFDRGWKDRVAADCDVINLADLTSLRTALQDDDPFVRAIAAYALGVRKDAASADAHRQSPHFKQYAVGGLYQKMKDRVREDLVALA